MDCRATLLLTAGLACGVLGCDHGKALPLTAEAIPPNARIQKDVDLPKRSPKPATLVAMAEFREREAKRADISPVDQERLRTEARKAYQQALDTDPKFLPAGRGLAHLYMTTGDHERAVATYRKAVKDYPREAALWHELGLCYDSHKDWEPALECLHKAVELDPENRQFANALGYTLTQAGRYDESLACFQKTGGPAQAHYNLARMLHHLKQDDLSRQHLEQALQADPKCNAARDLLARLDGRVAGGAKSQVEVGSESVNE